MPTYIYEDETGDLLTTEEDDEMLIVEDEAETVRVFTITLV